MGNLLITLPWGICILAAVFGWSADHTIAKRERTTNGVITAHQASRSDRYQYTFSVNGEKLGGSSGADDRHNAGEEVTVFYDPIDPNKSDLRDYKDLALRNFALVPFALTGIAGIAWYIWCARAETNLFRDSREFHTKETDAGPKSASYGAVEPYMIPRLPK